MAVFFDKHTRPSRPEVWVLGSRRSDGTVEAGSLQEGPMAEGGDQSQGRGQSSSFSSRKACPVEMALRYARQAQMMED